MSKKTIQLLILTIIFALFNTGNMLYPQTYVLLQTTLGNITIRLYDETPQHRDNFIRLVKAGFYDGLLFHRTINHFMIQAGDPASKTAKPGQHLGAGRNQPGLFPQKRSSGCST